MITVRLSSKSLDDIYYFEIGCLQVTVKSINLSNMTRYLMIIAIGDGFSIRYTFVTSNDTFFILITNKVYHGYEYEKKEVRSSGIRGLHKRSSW